MVIFVHLNCLHSFRTIAKPNFHKQICGNEDFSGAVMFSEDIKILEFKQYWKFDKSPFLIYVYVESFIKRIDGCKYNSKRSSTTKVGKNIPCGYSIFTIWTFDGIENKHDVYRGKDCIKKFCISWL